jgi:hypothetical protein
MECARLDEAGDPEMSSSQAVRLRFRFLRLGRLAELDGVGSDLDDGPAVAARVPALLADLVEPAKVTALEKLGEGERAIRIATGRVRSRTAQTTS